jgi:S1-C subfamily serine protease
MDDETIGKNTTPETAAEAPPEAERGAPPPLAPAAARSPAPRRRWLGWVAAILAVVVIGVGAFFLGRWAGSDEPDGGQAAVTTTSLAPTWTGETLAPGEEPVADVAAALSSSVVQIETGTGLGSGVIYRPDGYVVTAAHVVSGVEQVTVRLADGTRLDGAVVGADDNSDVAVVKVEQTGLPAAPIADSDGVQAGQMAIAIGSPWGLNGSVTAGVISSVQRTITGPDGIPRTMIQTDTPINPGNSGGALADRQGRVIGINDAIYSLSGGSDGVGFAIPIDTAVSVADRLIAGEEIRTAFLGVTGTDTTSGQAGALINGVTAGSPADEAGLQVGDLITRYDGQSIESFTDLGAAVRGSQPGDRVTLTVQRGNAEIAVEATLGERPDE